MGRTPVPLASFSFLPFGPFFSGTQADKTRQWTSIAKVLLVSVLIRQFPCARYCWKAEDLHRGEEIVRVTRTTFRHGASRMFDVFG
ncbi:hypothetical protein R1flu_009692 [Riccia fluitans]|uniref:Secreted protein n=1 Tax=Riccia fluitans TaxID=41844 RepID=A0ABD1Z2V4_9MARC